MKKRVILLFSILVLSIFIAGCATVRKVGLLEMPYTLNDPTVGDKSKMVIAVLNFDIPQETLNIVKSNPSERLITMLVKSKAVNVVEREKLENVLKEQKLSLSGIIDESTAIEVGKLVGAQAVVIGAITSLTQSPIDKFSYILYETKADLDVRIVDSSTGKVLFSEKSEGKVTNKTVYSAGGELISGAKIYPSAYAEAILKAVESIAPKISELFPPVAYVVSVSENRVMIDVGQDSGVVPGQMFIIFRKGKEIIHPVTKKILSSEKEVIACVEINKVEKGLSSGFIIEIKQGNNGNAASIIPGDFAIFNKN